MQTQLPVSTGGQGSTPGPLLERLRSRVARVQRVLEHRDKVRKEQTDASADQVATVAAASAGSGSSDSSELRALRVVYHGLVRAHKDHRQRSGQRASPALKAAARAFKQEPSVFSLARVAGYLDDIGLIRW